MQTRTMQDWEPHESRQDARQDHRYLAAARERGWITLEEIMRLASGSPVNLNEAMHVSREAGINLVDSDRDPWDDVHAMATRGADAFQAVEDIEEEDHEQEAAAVTDELMAGGPAALYLREISRTPLLTAVEEVQLAQEIEAGKAARAELGSDVTDAAERERLEDVVAVGDAARKRLIESNLRLVVSVARKYLGRGMSFLDLVQEGNIGLQRGVDKYDWRKGFRFSTYAYWWIRQAVSRAVAEQSRTIRLPVHIVEQLTKLYNVARDLERELGRQPTPEEIGATMGLDPERVRESFRAARVPISLETPIGDEGDSTIADLVADAGNRAPADEAEGAVLSQALDTSLRQRLTQREADVLKLRYGLADNQERTLAEVGKALGISRERARQLEAEAMRKLRRDAPFRRLFQEYLE
ncbi:MAG: sigma-70 family RNA polymerase sigma factor [Chloroflexi bacterium]|nr:sigma-70 family RNA polymerase sigma factor [Chloroflexota bacterium]